MTSNDGGDAPIYESLVGEQGDVLAQARQAAEEAQRTTHHALEGNRLSARHPEAFSEPQSPPHFPAQNSGPGSTGQPPPFQHQQSVAGPLPAQHEPFPDWAASSRRETEPPPGSAAVEADHSRYGEN